LFQDLIVDVINLRLLLTLNEAKAIIEVDNLVLVDGVASTTVKKNTNFYKKIIQTK